jgi:hypothetical protein
MFPSNRDSLDYVRFEVGDTFHMCHRETILKYPASLLAFMIDKSTRTSGHDYLTIERDGKYFATILNLMRYQNPIYAHGYTSEELRDLIEELSYYNLPELGELVSSLLRFKGHHIITTIYLDHDRKLNDIIRPTVIINGRMIQKVVSTLGIEAPYIFNLLKNESYDALVFEKSFQFEYKSLGDTNYLSIFLFMPPASKNSDDDDDDDEPAEIWPEVLYYREKHLGKYITSSERSFIYGFCQGLAVMHTWLLNLGNAEKRLASYPYVKFGDKLKDYLS